MHATNLVVGNNHPLQSRSQNYVLYRKLLTVHSEDRDVCSWPHANHFKINLPNPLVNVQSMRLVQASLPVNYYAFSPQIQNTKMWVEYKTQSGNSLKEIAIEPGFYCPEDLAIELAARINEAFGSNLAIIYDKIGQRYWFSTDASDSSIVFRFDLQNNYTGIPRCETSGGLPCGSCYGDGTTIEACTECPGCDWRKGCCSNDCPTSHPQFCQPCPLPCDTQKAAFHRCTHWGLGWNLGFNKKEAYVFCSSQKPVFIPAATKHLDTNGWWPVDPSSEKEKSFFILRAPHAPRLLGPRAIYMEVNKYNSYDELYPYSRSSNSLYNNDAGGAVNSAFAKIPITGLPYGEVMDSRNGFLQNVVEFTPPLERLQKLEFRFRYHDGTLVDFQGAPLDFTIEFNLMRDEIPRAYSLRVPPLYDL